jgi:3-methylfumaryl-CoA hydratase
VTPAERLAGIKPGDVLPPRAHTATTVSLFLYNAAIWNPHRIHYDLTWATEVEGHAGIVIDGPLQGDWLTQVVLEWVGDDGALIEFEYANRSASIVGATLHATGCVTSIDVGQREVVLELAIRDEAGAVLTPGSARVRFHPR